MSRHFTPAALAALAVVCGTAAARPNPNLDRYIAEKVKAELSKMDAPDRGYKDGFRPREGRAALRRRS